MSEFLNRKLSSLEPYTPGEQPKEKLIKLNTNESPYYPSRCAVEAIKTQELKDCRLYSDPESGLLRSAIADFYAQYGLTKDNVLVTNGSDESLAFSFAAFCENGAVFPDVTYGFYKVFASLFGVAYDEIPLNPDFTVSAEPYIRDSRTVFLANPNAQTGIYLPLEDVEKIVSSNPSRVVIIDEAYVDFGGETAVQLIPRYPNLIVIQTFSKSRSLAGARVGFAMAQEGLIGDLNRVKFSFNPYNVNRLSERLAAAAITDVEYFNSCRTKIMATRAKLAGALKGMGFTVLPSSSNFILAGTPKMGGAELQAALRKRGILVRHFDDERIKDYVRITIGSDAEIQTLIDSIKEILYEKG
ncbi:MAG: histidinol-phosphate transaminase [Clostridia bacterium]|nr:histidinol-phosphate transaminase [Clostridia bacterium]